MTALATVGTERTSTSHIKRLEDEVQLLIGGSKSSNTLRAYESDWRDFGAWCRDQNYSPLPATLEAVRLYLTDLATAREMKTSTIKRRLYSIGHFHRLAGHPSPREDSSIRSVMAGIRRRNGAKQVGKEPLLKDDLRLMVERLSDGLTAMRDKAILLLGFFSACRRSELVGLDVSDLEWVDEGLILNLRLTKTDQDAEGREVGIPYASDEELCPVIAVNEWLQSADINEGPVFRSIDRHGNVSYGALSTASIALIVKRSAKAAGIDPTNLSAHSLRSGFCTEAAIGGIEERIIMRQTGHKCERVVRGYIKEAVFQNNGAKALSF